MVAAVSALHPEEETVIPGTELTVSVKEFEMEWIP